MLARRLSRRRAECEQRIVVAAEGAARDGAGWHRSLEALDRALAGEQGRDYDTDHWRELRNVYAERFGPEASVLGPPQEWEDAYRDA